MCSLAQVLRVKSAEIYQPDAARIELGCHIEQPEHQLPSSHVIKSYKDRDAEIPCWVGVKKDYADVKEASDHLPLVFEFEI